MIYKSIRSIRIGLITIGFLAVLVSFFLPFYRSCIWNEDESGTIDFVTYSYETSTFYIQTLLVLAIFFSGYFYHDIVNKALLYTFSSMLILFLFVSWNAPTWGGSPCIRSSEIGGDLTFYGILLIMLGTFISIHREKE
jgi:hypothetical protein